MSAREMWRRDRWCRKRMTWPQWLLFYRRCNCPATICLPQGPGGPVEPR